MVHSALRWPEQADKKLWPLALQHAAYLHNHTPRQDSRLCPEEIWMGTKSTHSRLLHAHPWGCLVYVLDPRLQDGFKVPKWEPQSRQAQYMGFSTLHASTVGLVRNLKTGNISPQFHLVFDDWFETVHSSATEEPKGWQELIQFQSFSNDFDDDDYVPELGQEWLNQEELKAREEQDKRRCESGQQKEQAPREENFHQEPAPTMPPTPVEAVIPETEGLEVNTPGVSSESRRPTPGVSSESRHPTRERRQPERFTQNKECGYKVKARALRAQAKVTQHKLAAVSTWTRRMLSVAI